MKKRVLLAVIIVALVAAAAYTLHLLEIVVYSMFYSYGLQFNYEYWNLLRIIWALLSIIAAATIVSTILSIRPLLQRASESKPEFAASLSSNKIEQGLIQTRAKEKTPVAATPQYSTHASPTAQPPQTAEPSVSKRVSTPKQIRASHSPQTSAELAGLARCRNCGKSISQPLRMLDFQGDRPRIVEICPFCNETIRSTPRAEAKESDQNQDTTSPIDRSANHSAPKTITQ